MNAVEYINLHMDPQAVLDYYGFRHVQEYDEEIRSCCEIHKGNDPTAFIWNKRNNLWFCYTGPCHGGDVFTLVEKMEGKPFAQAVEKVGTKTPGQHLFAQVAVGCCQHPHVHPQTAVIAHALNIAVLQHAQQLGL